MPAPLATGVLFAVASAIAFGVTTPVIAWAGRGLGALTTAALLYAGAAAAAVVMSVRGRPGGTRLTRGDAPRVLAIAIAGGAVAPTCLTWGLPRTGATAGSLVLNLEAVFTVALAGLVHRELLGRRVVAAVAVMAAGGAALTLDATARSITGLVGALAIAAATLGWAIDNTWTRRLADRDPLQVIAAKGALGALFTGALAIARGEPMPAAWQLGALLGCGATGYGISLRLYLLAQRRIGAARTGSVFALAPFVGAAVAWSAGDRGAGPWTAVAAVCFALGVALHLSERHRHSHVHEAVDHEHAHRHDDGHHDHTHDPPFAGEHTHPHHHDRVAHDHDHASDLHHDHTHDR